MKVARDKLKEIGPDEVNMEEYKVSATFGLLAVRAHAFQSSVGNWECGSEQCQHRKQKGISWTLRDRVQLTESICGF